MGRRARWFYMSFNEGSALHNVGAAGALAPPQGYETPGGLTVVTEALPPAYVALPGIFRMVAEHRDTLGVDDSKLLADAALLSRPDTALATFAAIENPTPQQAYEIWQSCTSVPDYANRLAEDAKSPTGETLSQHIERKWGELTYHAPHDQGTLIGTPNPHFKSGTRYQEGYYWDIKDAVDAHVLASDADPAKLDRAVGILQNFAYIIDRFGFIPNGQRTYYTTRSQLPKYAAMVEAVATKRPEVMEEFLPQIVKEYNWWMKGARELEANGGLRASDHVLRMPDGSFLNRFWDNADTPSPEGHWEDMQAVLKNPGVPPELTLRRQRTAREASRDFTGQYMEDPQRIETAIPDRIAPVDLNALLWDYERIIGAAHRRAGRSRLAEQFETSRDARAQAMNTWQWNGKIYSDFVFNNEQMIDGAPSGIMSMTAAYAAARELSPPDRAVSTVDHMNVKLLKRWGYAGSELQTPHQWDENAWAPDQKEGDEANARAAQLTGRPHYTNVRRVARGRWTGAHTQIFRRKGRIAEKNHASARDPLSVVIGEYEPDDGFLWTNAVLLQFSHAIMEDTVACPTVHGAEARLLRAGG
jgi:alpha,alpha-trehalase